MVKRVAPRGSFVTSGADPEPIEDTEARAILNPPSLKEDATEKLRHIRRLTEENAVETAARLARIEALMENMLEKVVGNTDRAVEALQRVSALEDEISRFKAGVGGARWVLFGLLGGVVIWWKDILEFAGILRGG